MASMVFHAKKMMQFEPLELIFITIDILPILPQWLKSISTCFNFEQQQPKIQQRIAFTLLAPLSWIRAYQQMTTNCLI
jgi:hypothetical protein